MEATSSHFRVFFISIFLFLQSEKTKAKRKMPKCQNAKDENVK
jgi:hypothetical protein